MLKERSKYLLYVLIFLIILSVSFSSAKYTSIINGSGGAEIAKPIFIVKGEKEKSVEVYQGMKEVDYLFEVSNYTVDETSDLDFEYMIIIEGIDNSFPATYTLYSETGEEIKLVNNRTEHFIQNGNAKQKDKYILKVKWKEIEENLASTSDIKIKVEAVEKKK